MNHREIGIHLRGVHYWTREREVAQLLYIPSLPSSLPSSLFFSRIIIHLLTPYHIEKVHIFFTRKYFSSWQGGLQAPSVVGGEAVQVRVKTLYWSSSFYLYAIKTQLKARNAPSRGFWVPWAVSAWYMRAGVATLWSQPIRARCLDDFDQWEWSTLVQVNFYHWMAARGSTQLHPHSGSLW